MKGQYGGEIFTRTNLQLMPVVSLLSALGAVSLASAFLRNRDGNTIPRALLLLFFPAAYGIGMSLSHAFTYFPWYYGPFYPFLAALGPIGAALVTRSSRTAVFAVTSALVAAQLVAAMAVKLPSDSTTWVDGYFEVSKSVPRDAAVRVAAPEIGVVGWRAWPSNILDLEGLVTPAAVGAKPEEFFKLNQPDYLVVRTDNAAELLRSLDRDEWFARTYEIAAVRREPNSGREFRTYKKRGEE